MSISVVPCPATGCCTCTPALLRPAPLPACPPANLLPAHVPRRPHPMLTARPLNWPLHLPTARRTSNCYRITYRSMERSLTDEEINELQVRVVLGVGLP